VDGNSVEEVEGAAQEAVARARKGTGPTLIVARTFRHRGHFEGEVVTYWDKGELDRWKQADPVLRASGVLRNEAGISEETLRTWAKEIDQRIQEAVEFARQSPLPDPSEALDDLFWEKGARA